MNDAIDRLEDLGVIDVIVEFRNPYLEAINSQTREQELDLLRRYAEAVIAKTSP